MREQQAWERLDRETGLTYYIYIQGAEVVIGSRGSSELTDSAGSCTHAEFLAGTFQDTVREKFGREVLAHVLANVRLAAARP